MRSERYRPDWSSEALEDGDVMTRAHHPQGLPAGATRAARAVLVSAIFLGAFALPFYSVDRTGYGWVETKTQVMTGWELGLQEEPAITTTLTNVSLKRDEALEPGSSQEYVGWSEQQAKSIISDVSLGVAAALGLAVLSTLASLGVALRRLLMIPWAEIMGLAALFSVLPLLAIRLVGFYPLGGGPTVSFHYGYWLTTCGALLVLLNAAFLRDKR